MLHRLAAQIILLLLLAAAGVALGQPLWAHFKAQAEHLEEQSFRLAKMKSLASRRGEFEGQLSELKTALEASPVVMSEATTGTANAVLQARLKQSLAATGGRLLSAKPLADKKVEMFDLVTLSATVEVTNVGMQKLLHDLENVPPHLSVTTLTINSPQGRRGRNNRAEPRLRLRLTLRGVVAPSG